MIDGCGREIDHLRLSLTDRCNLACRYCIPEGAEPSRRMIAPAFAFEIVRWLSQEHGIRHVRLTGGEPLLYPDLIPLIEQLSALDTLHQVTLTTNAQALSRRATALRAAGLSRINISLDTLRADRFAKLTRGGNITHRPGGPVARVRCAFFGGDADRAFGPRRRPASGARLGDSRAPGRAIRASAYPRESGPTRYRLLRSRREPARRRRPDRADDSPVLLTLPQTSCDLARVSGCLSS